MSGLTDAELRSRLAEAEETLRAIREGEVDALVVRGVAEDQVFTLVGGDESYRAFMESMEIGAAALDEERRLVYANTALSTLLDSTPATLQAEGLFGRLGDGNAALIDALIDRITHGRQSAQIVLARPSGERHVVVTAASLPMSFSQGCALTFTDVTERIAAAAAEESERVGRAVLASANEAVVVCDRSGVVTDANFAVRDLLDASPIGKSFADAFPLMLPIGTGLLEPSDLVSAALAGNSLRGIEASAPSLRVKDVLVSTAPLRIAGDTIAGCVITIIDLSERKAAEKRQALVASELAHRVRNTLTLVLSISNRTVSGASDLADYGAKFSRRIAALAATHDLLAIGEWAGLTLEDLIAAELAPYVSPNGPRVRLRNLGVTIAADAAVPLGLIFHELVTNAVKYGALSNETGCVSISATDGQGTLSVTWEESGGPPVRPPKKYGFGQTLIGRGLGAGAGGSTNVEFRPEGLVCRIAIPAANLG
jgi:two-component sensor histidine kinase/PAS domain-containing protein